jgi:ribosome biogenesis GTPase A
MNQQQSHWYPGHMAKAIKAIQAQLKIMDLIIVMVDARAIEACRSLPLMSQKPKLYVVSKTDLADEKITQQVMNTLTKQGDHVVMTRGEKSSRQAILKSLHQLGTPLWQKQILKGVKPQPLKVMITGVPNVGKSTLINVLAQRHRVATENRPGSTRGQQWLKLDEQLILLDTPGILPPRYDAALKAQQLALIGSMPLVNLPLAELANYLYSMMQRHYPNLLANKGLFSSDAFFTDYGKKHGWLRADQVEYDKVYRHFIKAFQDGKLGRISLPILANETQP